MLEAGSTQTVTGALTLTGAEGNLLGIRGFPLGSTAFFDVQGTSGTSYIDVQDNSALPGNGIVLDANSVKGSNTPGWTFGIPVPLLGSVALALLALLLLVSGQRLLPRSSRADHAL